MMKLNIKIGAIVEFGFLCRTDIVNIGKVIEINDDEVIIVEQEFVSKEEYKPFHGSPALNTKLTVDADSSPIHIDRNLIASWRYFKIPDDPAITYYCVLQPSKLKEISSTRMNLYDGDGYCTGTNSVFN